VNKTVVVNADGTTETVDGLPKTGGDGKAIVLGTIGVFLLISGGSAMWIYRRRQQ
jgi:LPXTG-motif cell wall-anchored protein